MLIARSVHPLPGDAERKERLLGLVDGFSSRRVLVVGDLIADEFIYGHLERISREAPVLILKYDATEIVRGRGGNAASGGWSRSSRGRWPARTPFCCRTTDPASSLPRSLAPSAPRWRAGRGAAPFLSSSTRGTGCCSIGACRPARRTNRKSSRCWASIS